MFNHSVSTDYSTDYAIKEVNKFQEENDGRFSRCCWDTLNELKKRFEKKRIIYTTEETKGSLPEDEIEMCRRIK